MDFTVPGFSGVTTEFWNWRARQLHDTELYTLRQLYLGSAVRDRGRGAHGSSHGETASVRKGHSVWTTVFRAPHSRQREQGLLRRKPTRCASDSLSWTASVQPAATGKRQKEPADFSEPGSQSAQVVAQEERAVHRERHPSYALEPCRVHASTPPQPGKEPPSSRSALCSHRASPGLALGRRGPRRGPALRCLTDRPQLLPPGGRLP